MFDDLEQKSEPTEDNSAKQDYNSQPQAEITSTPAQDTPLSVQPGKVEDIFSETEKPNVFKPKKDSTPAVNNILVEEKNSGVKKIIILIVIILVLALFIWGMFLAFKYVNLKLEERSNEPSSNQDIFFPPEIIPDETGTGNNNEDNENLEDQIDNQLIDSDQDGLSDKEEYQLGTDINSVDTDIDGLFDREEIEVYKTNPLDSDTDGDGYLDGDEIKGGYNPNGPGELYKIEGDLNNSSINP